MTQLDIWRVLANILMYIGYGAAFLAFLIGLIMWGFGHKIGGRHVLDEGKTTIIRAIAVGMILGGRRDLDVGRVAVTLDYTPLNGRGRRAGLRTAALLALAGALIAGGLLLGRVTADPAAATGPALSPHGPTVIVDGIPRRLPAGPGRGGDRGGELPADLLVGVRRRGRGGPDPRGDDRGEPVGRGDQDDRTGPVRRPGQRPAAHAGRGDGAVPGPGPGGGVGVGGQRLRRHRGRCHPHHRDVVHRHRRVVLGERRLGRSADLSVVDGPDADGAGGANQVPLTGALTVYLG